MEDPAEGAQTQARPDQFGVPRDAIVGVCALAALITPPDPISMIAMAVPLMGLYEVAVLAVRFLEKRRAKAQAVKDAADA